MKKADKNIRFFGGGDSGNRTHDLLNAIQALYQLSYIPIFSSFYGKTCAEPRSAQVICRILLNYSPLIAPTGHPSSHAPQSMQTSGSIWYCVSPCEIAFTGQVSAQAPQEMQSSEILCAMFLSLRRNIQTVFSVFFIIS